MIKVLLVVAIGHVQVMGVTDNMAACRIAATLAMESLVADSHEIKDIYTDNDDNLQIRIVDKGWLGDTAGYISCQKVDIR